MLCALWRKTSACVHFSNFFFLWNLSFTVQWTFDGKESLCVLSVRTLRCHSKTYCGLTFCFQIIRYRKPRIWAMKGEKYTMKSRQKSGLCDITYERYSGKRLTKCTKLRLKTPSWCPFERHRCSGRKPTEASVFEAWIHYLSKEVFILRQGMFR